MLVLVVTTVSTGEANLVQRLFSLFRERRSSRSCYYKLRCFISHKFRLVHGSYQQLSVVCQVLFVKRTLTRLAVMHNGHLFSYTANHIIFNITTGSQQLAKGGGVYVPFGMNEGVCELWLTLMKGSLGQRRGSVAYKATSKPGHELWCYTTRLLKCLNMRQCNLME